MKWIKHNNAVYNTTSKVVKANFDDIVMLKQNVEDSPDKRIRICTHQGSRDTLHEMLIVLSKGTYIRPHKHTNKSESFHIIEGLLDVIIFDDVGNVINIIPMGNFASGKYFFYRLSTPFFHTLILHSNHVAFHETTNGPFQKEDTLYPNWSPAPENLAEVKQYMLALEKQCHTLISS
ncbi:MAG TPA: WbuC family cupin fold metalloprotein [Gammaproteobacteria bacterium]|nr:WbuC family cupin fold metalloprotein [Gammaproteobacteria bacterium]